MRKNRGVHKFLINTVCFNLYFSFALLTLRIKKLFRHQRLQQRRKKRLKSQMSKSQSAKFNWKMYNLQFLSANCRNQKNLLSKFKINKHLSL